MARQLRLEFPGAIYHVTSRGNAQNPIFLDEEDRVFSKPALVKWLRASVGCDNKGVRSRFMTTKGSGLDS